MCEANLRVTPRSSGSRRHGTAERCRLLCLLSKTARAAHVLPRERRGARPCSRARSDVRCDDFRPLALRERFAAAAAWLLCFARRVPEVARCVPLETFGGHRRGFLQASSVTAQCRRRNKAARMSAAARRAWRSRAGPSARQNCREACLLSRASHLAGASGATRPRHRRRRARRPLGPRRGRLGGRIAWGHALLPALRPQAAARAPRCARGLRQGRHLAGGQALGSRPARRRRSNCASYCAPAMQVRTPRRARVLEGRLKSSSTMLFHTRINWPRPAKGRGGRWLASPL